MELIKTEEGVALDPTLNIEQKEATPVTPNEGETKVEAVQPPTRYESETDTQYNLRVQLFNVTQAKKDPSATDEEKSILSEEMKKIRTAMAGQSKQAPENSNPAKVFETEEQERNAVENLKKLGFYTKEDIDKAMEERLSRISSESKIQEQSDAIDAFYVSRPDISADKFKKEQVEKWVLSNFKITPQSSKKEIELALDMTANYLFPRGQSKAKANEEKVNLVNISGGNSDTSKSTMSDSTYKILKENGWSDDKIAGFGK